MPTPRAGKSRIAIDTVPLPDKVLRGSLSRARGKYVLTVGRRKLDFPIGPLLPEAEARKLVGKPLAVAFSGTKPSEVVAIGPWPPPVGPAGPIKCYWVICYIPAPDMIRRIRDRVRSQIIRELQTEGVISARLANAIRSGGPRGIR